MAADYTKFKTPFYEIEVGDPNWGRRVKLPHHILRLVSKVEIIENMMVDNHQEPSQIIITFIEGSREPASPDYKMGTSGLYQIPNDGNTVDTDIAGSLTNRAGIITDLRFSGNNGITFLTNDEKKAGKIDNKLQKNVEGKDTTREYKGEKSSPMFLFQQRNLVKVTWGYIEDDKSVRSKMLSIMNIATNFPESGMPTTTITCTSSTIPLNQIATKNGKIFAKKEKVDKNGNSIWVFRDSKTEDLLQDIAKKVGMKTVISKNLINSTVDKDKPKMMVAGETPHQFFMRLAQASGCYYEIIPDPKSGQDVLYFIAKKDMHSRSIVTDKELLTWKGAGSILKSVNVSVDFSGLIGNQQKGLTPEGEKQSQDIKVSEKVFVNAKSPETNKKQELVPASPVGSNPHKTAENFHKNLFEEKTTGVVNYNPAQSTEKLEDTAHNKSDEQSRLVMISFTSIGYTKLMPGVMEISGIGVRYSGKYRIMNVTHTLDTAGYVTVCNGMSSFLGAGGVKVPDIKVQQEQDKLVDERLFNDTLGQYKKLQGG